MPWRLQLSTGLAIGLTLGVRIGGLILLAYLALAALVALVSPQWLSSGAGVPTTLGQRARVLARSLAGIGATAYVVMLIFWPWAQHGLLRPFEALAYMSRFRLTETGLLNRVLIGGEYLPAKDLPASYLPHYLLVKTPETLLLGLMLAGIAGVLAWRTAKSPDRLNRARLVGSGGRGRLEQPHGLAAVPRQSPSTPCSD